MVRLYKDPKGERVFTAHEEAMQVTTALGGPQAQVENEGDLLKRKVQQMEDIIKEYKVHFILLLTQFEMESYVA